MRIEDGRGPWRPFHEGVLDMKWVLTSIAAVAALAATGATFAQTKLKFAHVYEVSEPYHTAALWSAGRLSMRASIAAMRPASASCS